MKFEKATFPICKSVSYTDEKTGKRERDVIAVMAEGYKFDYCNSDAEIVKLGIYHAAKSDAIASDLWYVVDLDCGMAVAMGKTRKAAYDSFVNGRASKWERFIASDSSKMKYLELRAMFANAIERSF